MFTKITEGKYVNLEQVGAINLVSLSVSGNSKFRWVFHTNSEVVMTDSFNSIEEAEKWFKENIHERLIEYNESKRA